MAASSYAGSIVSKTTNDDDENDLRFGGGGGGQVMEAAFGIADSAVFATVLGVTVSNAGFLETFTHFKTEDRSHVCAEWAITL